MRGLLVAAILLGTNGLFAGAAKAQDIAETAVATSHSSVAASSVAAKVQDIAESAMATSHSTVAASGMKPFTTPGPAPQSTSAHLMARMGPPADEVNRKDFEDNAGENAGKLLLRSAPSGAQIFVNDLLVGRTPLLMVVAPGKYKIEMRGARQESGHSSVGVMPKETQTVVINLSQRYPSTVSVR